MPKIPYVTANINDLKTIAPNSLLDGYSRLVKSNGQGKPAWYTFLSERIDTGDDNTVVVPAGNPTKGRWLKSNIDDVSSVSFWKTISSAYTANSFDKLALYENPDITLPANPIVGNEISLLKADQNGHINIYLNGKNFDNQASTSIVRLELYQQSEISVLIYINESTGWIKGTPNITYISNSGAT